MVTSMSASWEARFQQITGSAIVVDDGNGWHDCPEGSAGHQALAEVEKKMEAKFENIQEQLSIISEISRTPSTAAGSDSGGTSRRKRPATGPMPEMFADALQNNEKDTRNPCRIWIGGWPRE
eukprot:9492122-Pyramimonas_sp.AAC.1